MDIKAFRGLSGTYNVRANERDRAAPRDIECLVYFLNNTQHKFVIDRRSKGQALLDCVFKHLNLIETDFFGLKYLPQDPQTNQNDNATANKGDTPLQQLESAKLKSTSTSHSISGDSSNSASRKSIVHNNNNYHDAYFQNNNNNSNQIKEHHGSLTKSPCLSPSTPPIVNHEQPNLTQAPNNPHIHLQQYEPFPSASLGVVTSNNSNNVTSNSSTNSNYISTTSTLSTACPLTFVNQAQVPTSTSPSIILIQTGSLGPCGNHCAEGNCKQHDPSHSNLINGSLDDNIGFVEERWLDPAKSIRKQYKSGPPYKFYFRVRFYVSDPSKLADDTTRNHLYLQLRQDILNNRLILPTDSAILLASYILQSEFGDYREELLGANYAAKIKLLPEENDDFRRKVIKLHKEHEGLSSADAEHQFLEHAAKYLDCYGVEFFDAQDQFKTKVLIGVSSSGIVVFKDRKKMSQFSWARIIKIMFKKKMFSIQLRREEKGSGNCDNFIEFNLISNQACKSFWEECVAQHSFFRLHQPKSPPKKFFSFFNLGSKFQYNGKTEYQTMEESRKRSFSHFSRTLSKRYARRTLPIGRPPRIDQSTETEHATTTGASIVTGASINNQRQSSRLDENSDSHSRISTVSSSSSRSFNNNVHQNLRSSTTLAESILMIKKGLDESDLIKQFEKLSRKKDDESHEESRLVENIDKNRYQDILPYDSTRVQLMDSMTGDYINASFVNMVVPPGNVNRYIATQGPLLSTCEDFWQMIWEQNCSLIIMVTPLIEAGRVKCHKYWPDEKEDIRYGQLVVRNLNEKSKSATIDRTLQLYDVRMREKRTCTQIQYKAWPDHEVPEDCSDFLKLVNRVKKHRAAQPEEPIVVHCSAGIGRTGVLILMETAICFMEAGEPIYPIEILEEMRRQRAMLIQTSSQFKFVAEAICKVYDQKLYKKRSKKSRKK